MNRIGDALGWVGGAVTVYWTLGLGAVAALWAASWAVRLAGRAVTSLATG